jgi:hypothetical protein
VSSFVDRFFATDERSEDNNRRSAIRTPLLQFVEMRIDEEVFGQASTLDISAKGMRVHSDRPLEIGTSMFLMFHLPGDPGQEPEIQGEYTVIHCDGVDGGWHIGLRAYKLSEACRLAIEDYVRQSADKVWAQLAADCLPRPASLDQPRDGFELRRASHP